MLIVRLPQYSCDNLVRFGRVRCTQRRIIVQSSLSEARTARQLRYLLQNLQLQPDLQSLSFLWLRYLLLLKHALLEHKCTAKLGDPLELFLQTRLVKLIEHVQDLYVLVRKSDQEINQVLIRRKLKPLQQASTDRLYYHGTLSRVLVPVLPNLLKVFEHEHKNFPGAVLKAINIYWLPHHDIALKNYEKLVRFLTELANILAFLVLFAAHSLEDFNFVLLRETYKEVLVVLIGGFLALHLILLLEKVNTLHHKFIHFKIVSLGTIFCWFVQNLSHRLVTRMNLQD